MDALLSILPSPDALRELLKPDMQAKLTQYLIVVGVIWLTMGRKVSANFKLLKEDVTSQVSQGFEMFQKHLDNIELKFDEAVKEMKKMRDALSQDLKMNADRLNKLEDGISIITKRVEKLEKP